MNTSSEILWFNQNIIFGKKYFSRIGFKVVLCMSKIFLEMALLEIVIQLRIN